METEKWRENQFKITIQLLVETSETLPIFLSPIFLSKIFAKMIDFYLYYSARRSRNQTARSVWSAWSLLPLSNRATHPTAGASSTHSIRLAKHDRPCHPSVQFAPYPPKICAKKQDFRLYYSARRAAIWVRRRAEDRRALPFALLMRLTNISEPYTPQP